MNEENNAPKKNGCLVVFTTMAYPVLAYVVVSCVFFGNPFLPLFVVIGGAEDFDQSAGIVRASILLGFIASIFVMIAAYKIGVRETLLPAILVSSWMAVSAIGAGLYLDHRQAQITKAFAPDKVKSQSVLWSYHSLTFEEYRTPHAIALKNCQPYNFSFRKMAYYELPIGTAVNVLPSEWLEMCNIELER